MPRPSTDEVAQRRARVAELTRDKLTIRDIATELGVTKDVVHRDQQWLKKQALATPRALFRDKADQARTAMAQLHAAVTATAAARPAYQVLIDDATAAQWIAQLRDDANRLRDIADTFRELYPHLTGPAATPHRDTATTTATG
ncbi:hypothetical protein AW27_026410 [Streptomyces sp. PCS3-D2]|uniref:hypothetical protein n=1 Tax=Streptomyces sp. PCS3-D2 TaxID=1460244 RepID=UPI00045100F5|nr:hypothetical protein [Streptomyces sp. PCS3-D2]WKV74741.1 hypothetical protein AW27_026410 [Streptomyces sp. PCS3-D2]